MRVLIQGAGIAGLALARELQQQGIDYLVVERANRLEPVGAGITLAANALRALSHTLDIDSLRARGNMFEQMRAVTADGRTLSTLPARLPGDRFGGIALHRHALHDALLSGIDPGRVGLGLSIARCEPVGDRVNAVLSDGAGIECDFLIGADGIRSAVREHVAPSATIRRSDEICWRAVVPHRLHKPDECIELWGAGQRLGYVQVAPDKVYIYATVATGRSAPPADARAFLEHRFAGLSGEAAEMVECLCRAERLIESDLEELRPIAWSRGRLLLIGDAAHAMTPNLGQGAAMAIEDAYVLARLWSVDRSAASLERFDRMRRPRVEFMQRESWRVGEAAQWRSRPAVWLRNALIRAMPASSQAARQRRILALPDPMLGSA